MTTTPEYMRELVPDLDSLVEQHGLASVLVGWGVGLEFIDRIEGLRSSGRDDDAGAVLGVLIAILSGISDSALVSDLDEDCEEEEHGVVPE